MPPIRMVRFTAPAPSSAVEVELIDGTIWQTDTGLAADTELRRALHGWIALHQPAAYVPPATLPDLSPRQLRLALLHAGLNEAMVNTAIDTIADPVSRESVRIEWEYGITYQRTNPAFDALAPILGLDEAGVDALWSAASTY